ncbi:hypothetical protein BS47DRAFT_50085 [Hydnum rufescens UP504]|uniref:Uncharacterized protein n=1 Tax=Hydnum rufescens UP504 TaxID=1448309 RepID=A0A9P6AS45_9AGAM|nr:hypothetical protein BS47DRAFT_50085 [Hydnum rufescens UP504]
MDLKSVAGSDYYFRLHPRLGQQSHSHVQLYLSSLDLLALMCAATATHREEETSPPRAWLHRFFPCFGSRQDLEDVTEEKTVVPPFSVSAMASAGRA